MGNTCCQSEQETRDANFNLRSANRRFHPMIRSNRKSTSTNNYNNFYNPAKSKRGPTKANARNGNASVSGANSTEGAQNYSSLQDIGLSVINSNLTDEQILKHAPNKTSAAPCEHMNKLSQNVRQILPILPHFDFFEKYLNILQMDDSKEGARTLRDALTDIKQKRTQGGMPESEIFELPELGPYRYPDGGTYFGQYKNGLRHGFGEQIWPDGSLYQGFFQNDRCQGLGRLVHPEGDAYQGEWFEDQAEGQGYYLHSDKTQYKGNSSTICLLKFE